MIKTVGRRPLRITAILLILAALAFSLILVLIESAEGNALEEALLSARFAVDKGDFSPARRALLRASRHALSAAHWSQILRLAASMIPAEAKPSDYRLFAALAGRASAALPGNEDLAAYLVWAMLRTGRTRAAVRYTPVLRSPRWSRLRSEVRLAGLSDEHLERLGNLSGDEILGMDGEFMEYAASLTESAELSVNAALLYMLRGELGRASALAAEVMVGNRQWYDPDASVRRGIPGALGRIAYDAGDLLTAAAWIQSAVDDARRRRSVNWRDLQLLGDIYWEMYTLQGRPDYRDAAADAWYGARSIALPSEITFSPPSDSWKVLINLASAEAASGSSRRAENLLREALSRFPRRGEVKAAWARANMHRDPAMARRMVMSSPNSDTPDTPETSQEAVLGIAALQINPEALTPRRYSARLWNLFRIAVEKPPTVNKADARIIAAALLEYLASIEDYAAVDTAVERYLRAYPRDHWVLAWRLAADASRGTAHINLIAENQKTESPYSVFRTLVQSTRSPRGLHDAALFASAAAEELNRLLQTIPGSPAGNLSAARDASLYADAAILSSPSAGGLGADGRIAALQENREDLAGIIKEMRSTRRGGSTARASAKTAILVRIDSLYSNALEDLALAGRILDESMDQQAPAGAAGIGTTASRTAALPGTGSAEAALITPKDKAVLLYLQARILLDLGRGEEAAELAAEALAADPFNIGARELLNAGTAP